MVTLTLLRRREINFFVLKDTLLSLLLQQLGVLYHHPKAASLWNTGITFSSYSMPALRQYSGRVGYHSPGYNICI